MTIIQKTDKEVGIMAGGGKKLAEIKDELFKLIEIGVKASEIEKLANGLIDKSGGQASFKMVPGYKWATCVNVNEGVVHGIPHDTIKFKKEDLVSVDIGLFYKGFHTDTSFSKYLGNDPEVVKFMKAGKSALKMAINKAKIGNRIFDISEQIENILESAGYKPIKALVGHGIGKKLHEDPHIPCITQGDRKNSPKIQKGNVFAIEVMYTIDNHNIKKEPDGWTISTSDGKISALFEETVAVTKSGTRVLTKSGLT